MTRTAPLFLALPLFLAVVSGCNDSATPATVSGKITYKGETVPSGSLTFHTEQGGIFSYSLKDGEYFGTDLPAGEYVVTVETESANPNPNLPKMAQPGGKGKDPAADYKKKMEEMGKVPATPGNAGPYVKIPSRYDSKKTSPLKVTVTRGKNTNDFALTD